MTILSSELKNYYYYEGNKILWRGGYTLNKLALRMWEKLGYREIDPGVLSKVIHGKRLFTVSQINVLCEILSLRSEEKKKLFMALKKDCLRRYGFKS